MFKMFNRVGIIVGFVLSSALVPQASWAADAIGKVVAVVGSPSAAGPAGSRGLKAGSEVFEDDNIKVSTGNAQILLNDGTKLVVGPSSTLLLDQFVMRGGSKAEKVSIKALRGTYRFITGRSAKSAYKISTANATIGIRGTGFDFWIKKKTGVVVLSGSVNLNGQTSGTVRVDSGCEMGEATTSNARQLTRAEKLKSIRENLPFIIDQSSLKRQFRLNIKSCNIGVSGLDDQGSSTPIPENPPEEKPAQRQPPIENPDIGPDSCASNIC
jgi:hypothetical protein